MDLPLCECEYSVTIECAQPSCYAVIIQERTGLRIKRECRRRIKFVPSKLNVQHYTSKIGWHVAKTKRIKRRCSWCEWWPL